MNDMNAVDIVRVCSPRPHAPFFVIGPYANKVSFVAQQIRALNLVYSLWITKKINRDDQVAIIGGGIAGLTAAVALVGYGVKVDLYESGATLLSRQIETIHRIVNPSITRWPHEILSATTSLRFLDWFEMPCSDVAKLLVSEFEEVQKKNPRRLKDLVGVKVTMITQGSDAHLSLELDGAANEERYAAVLVTLGFGTEDSGVGLLHPNEWVGYWTPDSIVDTRNNYPKTRFIISGAGDGGMIDLLRIVHRKFEMGVLPVTVARLLEGTDVANKIKIVENESLRDIGWEKLLDDAYMELVKVIDDKSRPEYQPLRDLLDASYMTGSPVHYLVDNQRKFPVSKAASPINKLLVYHAKHRNRVDFLHGAVQVTETHVILPNKARHLRATTRVIVRHGPSATFDNCITQDDLDFLKMHQMQVADELAIPIWKNGLKPPKPLPPMDPASPLYRDYRLDIARKYLNSVTKEYVSLKTTSDGYEAEGAFKDGVPTEAFGVKISTRPPIVASPILTI